jgi:drug/metabolite transporter (DMT)-like permease
VNSSGAKPYIWVLLSSAAFSIMAALTYGLGRHGCPWQVVALARSTLALVFSVAIALAFGIRLAFWRPGALWMRSLAGSASLVCSFYALTHLRTADAITLTSTFAIWIAILAWPLEGRLPAPGVWLALACSFTGVLFIQDPQFQSSRFDIGVALVCAFFSAIAMHGLHRIKGVDHLAIVIHFGIVASITAMAALLATAGPETFHSLSGTVLLMLIGVGASATVGQVFLTKAFATGPPTKVAIVSLSQIVFALLYDSAIWGHEFSLRQLVGILCVAAPSAWLMANGVAESHSHGATEPITPGESSV